MERVKLVPAMVVATGLVGLAALAGIVGGELAVPLIGVPLALLCAGRAALVGARGRGRIRVAWFAVGVAILLAAASTAVFAAQGQVSVSSTFMGQGAVVWTANLVLVVMAGFALMAVRCPGRSLPLLIDGVATSVIPNVVLWELAVQPALVTGRISAAEAGTALTQMTLSWVVAALGLTAASTSQGGRVMRFLATAGVALAAASVAAVVAGTLDPTVTVVADVVRVADAIGHVARLIAIASLAALLWQPEDELLFEGAEPTEVSWTSSRLLLLGVVALVMALGLLLGPNAGGDRLQYGVLMLEVTALASLRILDVLRERDRAIERMDWARGVLATQATYDQTTGLPNRQFLTDELHRTLSARRSDDTRCAVLFMDLDDFKLINDSFGHEAGDQVLRAVARNLEGAAVGGEVVGRFGGDEFVVIVPAIDHPDEALAAAHRFHRSTDPLQRVAGVEVSVQPSIGIAISDDATSTPMSLIRDADAAMYHAKRGDDPAVVFTPTLRAENVQQLQVEQQLRVALQSGGLQLAFQSIVDLATGNQVGVEALARWPRGQAVVEPDEFIPVAERSGLIHALGSHVLETSCAQWRRWSDVGITIPISVNVSARELMRATYVEDLRRSLQRHDVPGDQLTLELTERDVAGTGTVISVLRTLREEGVRIAVDDFGTGYFSLSQLRTVPIDTLKIDRSFVADVLDDPAAAAIVAACVEMAVGLGLDVIAEGVETEDQQVALTSLGCTLGQGFLFDRPTILAYEAHVGDGPIAVPMPIGRAASNEG